MVFVWIGLALVLLRYFDVGFFGQLRWYWVYGPLVIAFIWFEVFERRFGWDKKKAFDEIDKAKKERIKKALDRDKNAIRRR